MPLAHEESMRNRNNRTVKRGWSERSTAPERHYVTPVDNAGALAIGVDGMFNADTVKSMMGISNCT